MRGAVLHKLGLNIVKERIMRRHYGVGAIRAPFKHGKDPIHLKGLDAAGEAVCQDVMHWYAYKVPPPYITLISF
jgi:succinate dehydrogenase/fumarate reductase flavoprotein subunit